MIPAPETAIGMVVGLFARAQTHPTGEAQDMNFPEPERMRGLPFVEPWISYLQPQEELPYFGA